MAWSRWYRQAIEESARQLRKAERALRSYPADLFLDAKCMQPLPIAIPIENRRMHGVVIVSGIDMACRAHFPGGTGSMMINSDLKGDEHINVEAEGYTPFAIGDVNEGGAFLHVFNDATIEVLLDELTTVTDFISYLREREALLRSGKWVSACGEEDLLGLFLDTTDKDGSHSFTKDSRISDKKLRSLVVEEHYWSSYVFSSRYFDQRVMDRQSHAWDKLIETFGKHALQGTSQKIKDVEQSVSVTERCLRTMALETRAWRRHLAGQLFEAFQRAEEQGKNKYFRVSFPARTVKSAKRAYVFHILEFPEEAHFESGQEGYRLVRINFLRSYCMNLLIKYPNLDEVIGLGFDPIKNFLNGKGGSEDVIYAQQQEWPSDAKDLILKEREQFEIFQINNTTKNRRIKPMYPLAPRPNRSERRKNKSSGRKSQY